MRDEISEFEWTAFRPMVPTSRVAFAEQMIVACLVAPFGFRCAVARYDRELWPYTTCCALASGWNVGPEHIVAGPRSARPSQLVGAEARRVLQGWPAAVARVQLRLV